MATITLGLQNKGKNALRSALKGRYGTLELASTVFGVPGRTIRYWNARGFIPYSSAQKLRVKGINLSGLPVDKIEMRGRPPAT